MTSRIKQFSMFLLLAMAATGSQALTPSQVFQKVKDSVVVVKTLDTKGKTVSQGSGVLLPSGKIGTNCHVVKSGVRFQVGGGGRFVPATLWGGDDDKDICLLVAKGLKAKPAELGASKALTVGMQVYAVGAPIGLELSLSDGIVSQLRGNNVPLIQTTAAISPGSSGGGLFDAEGRLVGFTTLYIEGGQSLNFAMPVEWVAEIKPGEKKIVQGRSDADWVKRGVALYKAKDYAGLLKWCQKWTRTQPDNALAWYNLGYTCSILKRDEEAIDAYRQALRINPEYAAAWNNLGNSCDGLKRYDEAIDAYHQALRINPEFALAWNNLGYDYVHLQRYDDAIDAYRQALHFAPEDASSWYNLGVTYGKLKRYDDAIDAYRQALHFAPEDASSWYNLGVTYGVLKRYDDAIDAYHQTLRIDPQKSVALRNLAASYALSGNRSAALEAVHQLHGLDPAMADQLFDLIVPR